MALYRVCNGLRPHLVISVQHEETLSHDSSAHCDLLRRTQPPRPVRAKPMTLEPGYLYRQGGRQSRSQRGGGAS
jgi:hypothetical protein